MLCYEMDEKIICDEIYGSRGKQNIYLHSADTNQIALADKYNSVGKTSSYVNFNFSEIVAFFKEAFLPQGYPDSVSEDYLHYQIWDSIQAFTSRLISTLSTQAVLKGIGVGDELSTPLAATLTWLLRDGTSMLGRIIFAWYEGTSLDYNSKQWRLFADVMNDIAMCFDLLAAHVGALSTWVLCVAGVCRAMVEASGSATRAAFIQHQAKRGNLADVAAKDGSQETLVNLAGLLVSIILIHIVANNFTLVWILYFILTFFHLFANYKAVRAVSMNTLNQLRLSIIIENYLFKVNPALSVKEVNLQEPVILGSADYKIKLGCSFNSTNIRALPCDDVFQIYDKTKYILTFKKLTRECFITLHKNSSEFDQLESCFQAHVILFYIKNMDQFQKFDLAQHQIGGDVDLLKWSRKFTANQFPKFIEIIERYGWKTASNLLGAEEWRAEWNFFK